MTPPVYIVAMAARTCVGLTAEATAAAVRAGVSRISEHPLLSDPGAEPLYCGAVASVDSSLQGVDRLAELGSQGVAQIIRRLAVPLGIGGPIAVHLAFPEPRPGHATNDSRAVATAIAERIDTQAVRVHCVGQGHAGALLALKAAVEQVAHGRAELAIAGGLDSYLHVDTIDWLDQERRLARSGTRAGFAPGEGVALLAVASQGAVKRLGMRALARVRAVASAQELRSIDSQEGLLGEGLSEAVSEATRELSLPGECLADLYGDINGERHRTDDWGFTVLRNSHTFRDGSEYTCSVGSCGDLGAATSALGCVLAVHSWQRHYARGPLALVWAGSWNGLRTAALLEQQGG